MTNSGATTGRHHHSTETGNDKHAYRYFVSYSGVRLPFNLVNPITLDALTNRNTFIRAWFDGVGLLLGFDKLVYGEIELSHRYGYHRNGRLMRAEVTMLDEEPITMSYDETGMQL